MEINRGLLGRMNRSEDPPYIETKLLKTTNTVQIEELAVLHPKKTTSLPPITQLKLDPHTIPSQPQIIKTYPSDN